MTPEEFKQAMEKAGPAIRDAMVASLLQYSAGFAKGNVPRLVRANLHNRRGAAGLSGAFEAERAGTDDDPSIVIYTRSPYARIQEYGGTVRPKTAKYLTIPLAAARTAAGVTRGSARNWIGATFGRSRRGGFTMFAQGKQVMRSRRRGGSTFEYQTTTTYLRGAPIFLLRKQVTIPARFGLIANWNSEADKRKQILVRSIDKAVRDARRKPD